VATIPPVTAQMNETERQLTEVLAQVDDWQGRSVEYTPVTGGITNPNFLVTVDDREFFLKIPGRGTDAFIDRDNCHAANRIAADAGIGPPTAYYLPSAMSMNPRSSLRAPTSFERSILTRASGCRSRRQLSSRPSPCCGVRVN